MRHIRQIFRSITLYSVLSLLFVLSAQQMYWYAHQPPNVEPYVKSLQKRLVEVEHEVDYLVRDLNFMLNALDGMMPEDSVKKYEAKPYTILAYERTRDSLVYWNNYRSAPYRSDVTHDSVEQTRVYEARGSFYLFKKRPYDFVINQKRRSYTIVVLIPLHERYPIQNSYLKNRFPLVDNDVFNDYLEVSNDETPFALKNSEGEHLLYLRADSNILDKPYLLRALQAYILTGFFLFLALGLWLERAEGLRQGLWRLGIVGLGLLLMRVLMHYSDAAEDILFSFEVLKLPFKADPFYLGDTLGEFWMNTLLMLFWSVMVLRWVYRLPEAERRSLAAFSWMPVWALASLWLSTSYALQSLETGLQSSELIIDLNRISNLNSWILGLFASIGLRWLAGFLMVYLGFRFWLQQKPSWKWELLGLLVLLLFDLAWTSLWGTGTHYAFCLGAILVYWALQRWFAVRSSVSLTWMSTWIIFFAALTTLSLEYSEQENMLKLRQEFAKKLALERDTKFEESFVDIDRKLIGDDFFRLYLGSALIPSRQAQDIILYRYLDDQFFGRYQYGASFFTADSLPYRTETRQWEELEGLHRNGQACEAPHLAFCTFPAGGYMYVAKFPIRSKDGQFVLGYMFLEFRPLVDFEKSNVYVELLSLPKDRLEQVYSQLDFALYKYNRQVATRGEAWPEILPYTFQKPDNFQHRLVELNGRLCTAFKDGGENMGLVVLAAFSWRDAITSFSYIFAFGVLCLALLLVLQQLSYRLLGWTWLPIRFEESLRERVQRGMILVSMLSLFVIATITVVYFRYEYTEYHKARLQQKTISTAQTVLWQIQNAGDSLSILPDARRLADIHKIDLNLYDRNGHLLRSSEEAIFERRLISRQMHSLALYKLKVQRQSEYIQDEYINDFRYLSAYVPLVNRDKEVVAFLNLPYDLAGNAQTRTQDVVEFLGTLINVYVMFLLLAGLVALLIANSIAAPLLVVGEKLKSIKLGQKNQPLEWHNRDEVGVLVERYNEMIQALEQSTLDLSRSQRESAWREMAKQVAHEIKNPLTPMKLHIQMLERVLGQDPERAKTMGKRISNALIEQIDNLAHIASEFSNFAKMPQAENEVFVINEVLQAAVDLFREEINVAIQADYGAEALTVFADKKQMLRVFNNLLKNAVQAIPEGRQGQVEVILKRLDTQHLQIEVSDNGIGIPESRKDDIFVPNFTTKTSGTGIGLSMSKQIVEQALGRIYFESKEAEGTRFFVELPLHKAH